MALLLFLLLRLDFAARNPLSLLHTCLTTPNQIHSTQKITPAHDFRLLPRIDNPSNIQHTAGSNSPFARTTSTRRYHVLGPRRSRSSSSPALFSLPAAAPTSKSQRTTLLPSSLQMNYSARNPDSSSSQQVVIASDSNFPFPLLASVHPRCLFCLLKARFGLYVPFALPVETRSVVDLLGNRIDR